MAAPLLHSSLQTIPINLVDMTGRVTAQRLTARAFDVYESKSLVFSWLQRGATGSTTETLISSMEELAKVHRAENIYSLLPRRARTNSAYLVMRAICGEVGTPFTMDMREDPMDYRLVFRNNTDMEKPRLWCAGKNLLGLHQLRNMRGRSVARAA